MRNLIKKVYTGDPPGVEHPATLDEPVISFLNADEYVELADINLYAVGVPPNDTVFSYERWIKLIFDDSDTTTITNLRMYLTGNIAEGAFLRIGLSPTYMKPVNYARDVTNLKTYGLSGGAEIIATDPATWLSIPTHYDSGSNIYFSDFIVLQLALDGTKLTTLDVFDNLELHFQWSEA